MDIDWVHPKRGDDLDLPSLTNCLEVGAAYGLAIISWPVAIASLMLHARSLVTADTAAASIVVSFGLTAFGVFEWVSYQLFGQGFFRAYWVALTTKGGFNEWKRILRIGLPQVVRQRRFEKLERRSQPR